MGVIGKGACAAAAANKGLEGAELRAQHSCQCCLVRFQVVRLDTPTNCSTSWHVVAKRLLQSVVR